MPAAACLLSARPDAGGGQQAQKRRTGQAKSESQLGGPTRAAGASHAARLPMHTDGAKGTSRRMRCYPPPPSPVQRILVITLVIIPR